MRLFEAGGELRSALRNALAAKDLGNGRRLLGALKPEDAEPILEKAGAYELLMEHYVAKGDFANVARLYERARQFDQAALAWERAGKLASARKAYERAKDLPSAARVRDREVASLLEKGDRLGAAILLVGAGEKAKAVEILSPLPGPKAFRFFQRVGLNDEAQALAKKELEKAEAEGKPQAKARWLELTERHAEAAQTWEAAGRKDKAWPLYEKLGDLPKAAAFAEESGQRENAIRLYEKAGNKEQADKLRALPPPPPPEKKPPPEADEEGEAPAAPPAAAEATPPPAPSEGQQET
jgi:tetratricopeptide (TPR) repeat protein